MFRFLILTLLFIHVHSSFLNQYPKLKTQPLPLNADPGKPLFLTPLLKAGNITEAVALAEVPSKVLEGIKSYAGYFTINEQYNSNLFFWYFPPLSNATTEDIPVIVWLQGGPGATSLYGLFTENGPVYVHKMKHGLRKRKYTWNINAHVIYIDNPVGTGWSFTENDAGYAKNETQVGEDLYNGLMQFFTLFPGLLKNPFFVTGESYGGKYVPALSFTIHVNNVDAATKINLQGLAIGNLYF